MSALPVRIALSLLAGTLALVAACTANGPPRAARSSSPTEGPARMPLVFAVHATRPPIDLARDDADALMTGRAIDWSDLGEPPGPVRLILAASGAAESRPDIPSDLDALKIVERDRTALAVVSAAAVGPTVRTLTVDGADPLTQPAAYALKISGAS